MDDFTKIKHSLQRITGKAFLPEVVEVTDVSEETCTVKFISGLEVSDVRLKSTANSAGDYLILLPKVGSKLTVMSLTGSADNLIVIQMDEVEKIKYKQAGLELEADSTTGKVQVKNDQVSLKDVMDALSQLLKQFKVFTPAGPSGTPLPDTVQAIMQFENKYKQLLK